VTASTPSRATIYAPKIHSTNRYFFSICPTGLVRVRIHAVVPAVAAVSTAPGPEATRAARADRTKRSASVRAAVATDPNTMATRTAAVRARHRVARIPNRSRAVVAVSRQRPEVAKTDVMIEAIQDDTSS
jgi:hypothetical protein